MSKTNKDISKYLGYKFYKPIEGSDNEFELIRIIDINEYNDKVIVKDLDTGLTKKLLIDNLKGYTPLEPTGFVIFSKIGIKDIGISYDTDVLITLYRLFDIKMKIFEPYAICRQGVADFFYSMISGDVTKDLAGISCSRENCPPNVRYEEMASCDKVFEKIAVHFYLDDTIDNLLECIHTDVFDDVLERLYVQHMTSLNPLYDKKDDKRISKDGWCRNLRTLLIDNNFQNDMDTMRNITAVDFKISDYIKSKTVTSNGEEITVDYLDSELLNFIANTFRINIKDNAIAVKFDVDVDLGDFSNNNYVLLRDNENITYIISYVVEGEYREQELVEENSKLSPTDLLRIQFYNKYNDQN